MDCISQRDSLDMMDGGDVKAGRWTNEEHNLFLQGLHLYNKQWKQIAELVKTRTVVQIRTHAQKYFQKMDKMKDGKTSKPPSALMLMDSSKDDYKSSSRSSSITSEDSLDSDADTDTEEFRWETSIQGSADTPRNKRPRERQSGAAAKQGRANKRPNLGNTLSISTESQFDMLAFPADEGPALDQSIVTLLEKIDWSLPYSRCASPFMDSAASVCSGLDTLQEAFPFFDFSCNTELSTPRTVSGPDTRSSDSILGKERIAFSNVVKEMKQVFSSYKIGSYDRLPSIKTLLTMRSSSISVTCTSSLTPSHSTFCHYQLSDSPNLFNDQDFHPIGGMGESDALGIEALNDDDMMDTDYDNELLSPTPRKRGRPRKNSI